MRGDKHFRSTLLLGLGISALLIGVGFWQSVTMGIVCLVGCGALLTVFCLYTRNRFREIRRLSDHANQRHGAAAGARQQSGGRAVHSGK